MDSLGDDSQSTGAKRELKDCVVKAAIQSVNTIGVIACPTRPSQNCSHTCDHGHEPLSKLLITDMQ